MKRGLSYPHRRSRRWVHVPRAALALPAAALLLYSCDPPASPNSAAAEVIRISGLPNMAEIERRLNAQYAKSAESTDGVEFTPPSISGTTVGASITYAEGKLLPIQVGGKDYEIKSITIIRVVDGKTIPTRIEYKDKEGTTRKTITSRYVPPPKNVASNNARQSLEGGPQFAEAGAEGRTLHIRGEERDGEDNTLRTFTATEEIQGGKIKLKTTYRRDGFTETVTTENGIPTQKVETYPDKEAAAKNIKTKTITYEESAESMFYPARQKFTLAMYRDAEGEETKRDEPGDGGSILTTMRDGSTITTTFPKDKVTLAVHKDKDGNKTKSIETTRTPGGGTRAEYKDAGGATTEIIETTPIENGIRAVHKNPAEIVTKSIETTRTAEGGTLAVHKNPDGAETQRVETKKDGSTITTTPTADGGTLAVYRNPDGAETQRVETRKDGSTITTTPAPEGGTLAVHKNPGGTETQRVETKSDGSSITTSPAAKGGTLVVYKDSTGTVTLSVETRTDKSTITTTPTPGGGTTKELVIHPSVTAIEDNAFENSGLTSLTMGNAVQSIGSGAFQNNQLTSLTIGNSVKTIGRGAFRNNKLFSVTIGKGLKTIEPEVFLGNKLYSVEIPPSVTTIESKAFYQNKLTSLTIGNGVKTIGYWAFAGNFKLKGRGNQLISLKIPPSVTKIGNSAFRDNPLTSLEIPPSVTVIEGGAFYKNELVSVSIPASIDSLGKSSFGQNLTLKIVRITGTGPIRTKAFTYLNRADPESEIQGVFGLSDSTGITLIIEDGVTSIGDSAFANSRLTSVKIGNGVRTIGGYAFERNKLTAVTIPPSVTAIGEGAFSKNKLTLAILPKALSKTRETAFNGNPASLQFREP